MGWNNPTMSWGELERRLSGRVVTPQDPRPRSRRASANRVGSTWSGRSARSRRTPSCTAAPPSASSTVPADWTTWCSRRCASGCTRSRSPTTTGSTGTLFAETARLHAEQGRGIGTIYGAELSLGLTKPQNGVPDPGQPPAGARARGRGLPPAGRRDHRRPAARRREGQARLRPGRAGRASGWSSRGHWLVLTGCPKGTVRQALARPVVRRRGAGPADRAVRPRARRGRARRPRLPDRLGAQRPARSAGRRPTACPTSRPTACTTRGPSCTAWQARWPPYAPGGPGGDGRLAAGVGMASLRSGRRWRAASSATRRGRAQRRDRRRGLLRPAEGPARGCRSSCPTGGRLGLAAQADRAGLRDPATPVSRTSARRGSRSSTSPDHRAEGLRRLLRDRPRHRRVRPRERDPLPGQGIRASSAVCYALGITAIDPVFYRLPFERFISQHREEPTSTSTSTPTSGSRSSSGSTRSTAATTPRRSPTSSATGPRWRCDAAKALGHSPGQQDAWSGRSPRGRRWRSARAASTTYRPRSSARQRLPERRATSASTRRDGADERPIGEVVPIERARNGQEDRDQWDKDACEFMGLVKFDLLGLGMISALDHG